MSLSQLQCCMKFSYTFDGSIIIQQANYTGLYIKLNKQYVKKN